MTGDNNGSSAASGFTVKEILLELRGDVKTLSDKIDRIDRTGSIGTKTELSDHEERIRGLENIRWRGLGALAVLMFETPLLIVMAWQIWG